MRCLSFTRSCIALTYNLFTVPVDLKLLAINETDAFVKFRYSYTYIILKMLRCVLCVQILSTIAEILSTSGYPHLLFICRALYFLYRNIIYTQTRCQVCTIKLMAIRCLKSRLHIVACSDHLVFRWPLRRNATRNSLGRNSSSIHSLRRDERYSPRV